MMYEQQLQYLPYKDIDELQNIIDKKVKPCRYAMILHDKDEGVDPHIHAMLDFGKNARHITAVAKQLGDKPQYIKKWDNRSENGFAYLVHRTKGGKEKYQYPLSDVIANFNYASMIMEQTKNVEKRSSYSIKTKLDLLRLGAITKKQLISELSGSEYAMNKRKIDDIDHLRLVEAAEKWRENMKAKGATVKVIWIFGASGTGKSSLSKELAEKIGQPFFISGSSRDMFQEYNGEHTIILDELRPNIIPYQDLLRITDPHGMTETHTAAPSRYFDKALAADVVIITTPYYPYSFYSQMFTNPIQMKNDPFSQFNRRISMTIECTDDLICEVNMAYYGTKEGIIKSRPNPYSEKNRTQEDNNSNEIQKLIFG